MTYVTTNCYRTTSATRAGPLNPLHLRGLIINTNYLQRLKHHRAAPQVKRILRSAREIRKMRAAGLVVWQAHQAAYRALKPGITTGELNDIYRQTFADYNATSLFLNYGPQECPFPAETCISINEEVVHGIPGEREVQDGDVDSLDTGCSIDNWCGDAAVTFAVGEISPISKQLMEVTVETLDLAIELLSTKKMWSAIAA